MPEPSSHLQLTPPELSYCWEGREKKKYAPFAYPQPVCGGCADRLGHVRQAESTLIVPVEERPVVQVVPSKSEYIVNTAICQPTAQRFVVRIASQIRGQQGPLLKPSAWRT